MRIAYDEFIYVQHKFTHASIRCVEVLSERHCSMGISGVAKIYLSSILCDSTLVHLTYPRLIVVSDSMQLDIDSGQTRAKMPGNFPKIVIAST